MVSSIINEANKKKILEIAGKYGITDVRVFGSVARREETKTSDLDLLIRMKNLDLMELSGFKISVEEIVGRTVDVSEENSLHWYIKDKIIEEAKSL